MKFWIVILMLLPALAVEAHDLWLEREEGNLTLYYGHSRSEHAGAKFLAYPAEWVREARCFDKTGASLDFAGETTSPYQLEGDCAAAYVLTSSGYWTKTPYGTKNIPNEKAEMGIKSWLSYESVKRIDRWGAALAGHLTGGLEIIPLENPLVLEPGEKMHLLVTDKGHPVEGVVVTYDAKPRGQTGADGKINIRVRHGGFQFIQASMTRPDAAGKADEIVYTTNLNFELPEE